MSPQGAERSARLARIHAIAGSVPDPEIPVITLAELGILREVLDGEPAPAVVLTPTYVGCPATEAIAAQVRQALAEAGEPDVEVRTTLSPPWTTDWITPEGREKLRAYGIAPPGPAGTPAQATVHIVPRRIACPRCGSSRTERLAAFGSTPCKALHRCIDCREPFDYFKPY